MSDVNAGDVRDIQEMISSEFDVDFEKEFSRLSRGQDYSFYDDSNFSEDEQIQKQELCKKMIDIWESLDKLAKKIGWEQTLTDKQEKVLAYIIAFIALNGYSPTYAQIAKGLGFGSQTPVVNHVEKLVKGAISKDTRNSARISSYRRTKMNMQLLIEIQARTEKEIADELDVWYIADQCFDIIKSL